jgi:hypothetical protein
MLPPRLSHFLSEVKRNVLAVKLENEGQMRWKSNGSKLTYKKERGTSKKIKQRWKKRQQLVLGERE